MSKKYTDISLEKCIKQACIDLGVKENQIEYNILDQKKGLFLSRVIITANIKESVHDDEKDLSDKNIDNGTVSVHGGKIIVKNPTNGGSPACILPHNNLKILVDGECINYKKEVFESSLIQVIFEEDEIPKRNLKIEISETNMEAYMSIEYMPQIKYILEDSEEKNLVTLKAAIKETIKPPIYTIEEIKQELSKLGVIYGIIDKNILSNMTKNCEYIEIAEGKKPINGEDDKIDIKFETKKPKVPGKINQIENVDFKNIGAIEWVNSGDVIAEKILGNDGEDGINIRGVKIKAEPGKKVVLKVGQGAHLLDENTAISNIKGKPCIKSNIFYVYGVHEVQGDVDLSTGNIQFVGDVVVSGTVREGMSVEAGNSVEIKKDVERATIKSKGTIDIEGNIIKSDVIGGGEDVLRLKLLEYLCKMEVLIEALIAAVEEIKRFNMLGTQKKDGEIIKILLENKFKKITQIGIGLVSYINMSKEESNDDKLILLIKQKLIGIRPLTIKNYRELYDILDCIRPKKEYYSINLALPVDVNISYCQDSKINSTGNIYVQGKGQYVSELISQKGIYFEKQGSVARGGTLKATNEIICKEVGSEGGVSTRLEVTSRKGQIYVDIAYQNTTFIIDGLEYTLDAPSKNIHAYLNSKGELFVDKLKL